MLSLEGRAHSEMGSTQPEGAASAGTKGTANSNENASEGMRLCVCANEFIARLGSRNVTGEKSARACTIETDSHYTI